MALSRKQAIVGGSAVAVAVVVLAAGAALIGVLVSDDEMPTEKRVEVKAKHAVNGHYVKLNQDDRLIYAGIRAPYDNEPFYQEAKQRNAELVEGKKLRLRFDEGPFRDERGRLLAYAFVDELFVNATLVREGLAYVRLTPDTKRFAADLLRAQAEARRNKRGLWSVESKSDEQSYVADPKYGNFHRPSCVDMPRIDAERRVELKSKKQAFDNGLAPCNKCLP